MYTENLHILGQPKKKICEYCGRHAHPFTTKCQHNDLTSRIRNLLDRNALMPQLIEQNKELREMALTFEAQFDNIAKTLLLCEQVVMEEPNGKDIWNKFTDRMEKQWPKKTSSPGTEEITKNSNQDFR